MANNESVIYKGEVFAVLNTGRYYCSGRHGGKNVGNERLLHRRIWVEHNGKIPENHHIHHIDDNWRNNNIENLECIEASEHSRLHMEERFKDDTYREKNRRQLIESSEKAKEWHKSEEGREWHKQHAKKQFSKREYKTYKCEVCGKEAPLELSRDPVCSHFVRNTVELWTKCRRLKVL